MEYNPLAPSARTLFHLKALVRLCLFWTPFIFSVVIAIAFFYGLFWGIVLGVGVWLCIAVLSVWYPSFAFERWGYLILDDVLLITWGVWFRHFVAIPLHRIQHVDIHQGPLDQMFGLSRLQIYTASGMGADGFIPGLYREDAEALRTELVAVGGDDGV